MGVSGQGGVSLSQDPENDNNSAIRKICNKTEKRLPSSQGTSARCSQVVSNVASLKFPPEKQAGGSYLSDVARRDQALPDERRLTASNVFRQH